MGPGGGVSWEGGGGGERGTDDAVELGAFVALGPALGVLALAGAELAEVFGGAGDDVGEEFEGYPA